LYSRPQALPLHNPTKSFPPREPPLNPKTAVVLTSVRTAIKLSIVLNTKLDISEPTLAKNHIAANSPIVAKGFHDQMN
jgi:hypothetical protein